MAPTPSLSDAVAGCLAARGVRRMFGVPGGGSSLDLIDAAGRAGIDFVLTQTEAGAGLMAAVTGELTGAPGVALAGIGPGAAAAVNGVAYAHLEQAPLVLFTDCKHQPGSLHQAFDQNGLFAPITRLTTRLRPEEGACGIERILEASLGPPPGPVHVDLSATDAGAALGRATPGPGRAAATAPSAAEIEQARALLGASRRPVVVVGLEARDPETAAALLQFVAARGAAVMPTYKAKGVMADAAPAVVGPFTGARAEDECLHAADLVVLCGYDPVEAIPGPWPYRAPVLELSKVDGYAQPAAPAARLIGPLAASLRALSGASAPGWPDTEIGEMRSRFRRRLELGGSGHTAQSITRALGRAAPAGTRLTVDAGAHMISALCEWQATRPFGVLKSNGLSSMGFAVPAAIASALAEPEVPVAAVTGDGGLLMALGELATAARTGRAMVIVAVNDAALSLIDVKQQHQQRRPQGVRIPRTDLAAAARALGCAGIRVGPNDDLDAALGAAFAEAGPVVVDVAADPGGYGDQVIALRG